MAEEENTSPPNCPKCGATMVLQKAQRGRYRGNILGVARNSLAAGE